MSEEMIERGVADFYADVIEALDAKLAAAEKLAAENAEKAEFLMREALSAIADGEGDAMVIARSTLAALRAVKEAQ